MGKLTFAAAMFASWTFNSACWTGARNPYPTPRFPAEGSDYGSTLTLTAPTMGDDDVLVAIIVRKPTSTTISSPDGFELVESQYLAINDATAQVWCKHVSDADAEPVEYTWTFGAAISTLGILLPVANADTDLDEVVSDSRTGPGSGTISIPLMYDLEDDHVAIHIAVNTYEEPLSMTEPTSNSLVSTIIDQGMGMSVAYDVSETLANPFTYRPTSGREEYMAGIKVVLVPAEIATPPILMPSEQRHLSVGGQSQVMLRHRASGESVRAKIATRQSIYHAQIRR